MRAAWLILSLAALCAACRHEAPPDQTGSAERQPPDSLAERPDSPDERLEGAVIHKLLGDPQLPEPGAIQVSASGGLVTLQGWVDSVNVRTLAEADAWSIPGVVAVDNRLLLRRPPTRPNQPVHPAPAQPPQPMPPTQPPQATPPAQPSQPGPR